MRGQSKERGDAKPFQHATGRWAKKVNGKLFYLGYVKDDPKGKQAWQTWLDIRDEVRAGRTPRRLGARGVTIKGLCDEFLNHKRLLVESGDITGQHHRSLEKSCRLLATVVGKLRIAAELAPEDFALLRSKLADRYGPERLKCEIVRIKSVFRWGSDNGIIPAIPKMGTAFAPPAMRQIRLARAERGQRCFRPGEIRKLLAAADDQFRAVILLALNAALGQADIAGLTLDTIREAISTGFLSYPRHKTGIPRRCWLWPETVVALETALAGRTTPARAEDDSLALLSPEGLKWSSDDARLDRLGRRFKWLLGKCKLTGKGLSFYRLRHTWRTVADEVLDAAAADLVMGHLPPGMSNRYRQKIGDDRVRRVCEHVRTWLYGTAQEQEQTPKKRLRIVG